MEKTALANRGKIESLQALRALAFLGIFFSHSVFFISWSALGVTVFYVMSGFLMTYAYGEREFDISLKNNFLFSVRKIKKLYPLHIITMLCFVALELGSMAAYHRFSARSIGTLLEEIGLNVTLLQTWVPYSEVNVSLNGVAWYLSVTLFLYFMFPILSKVIRKHKIGVLIGICVAILVAQVALCIPFIAVLGKDSKTYIWFMYCFPVFRLGDFFIGGCLGKLYSQKHIMTKDQGTRSKKTKLLYWTIAEALATALTVLVVLFLKQESGSIFGEALRNRTTLYIPIAAIWIYLFAKREGLLTRLLCNKPLIFLGNISTYLFLIHYVVTEYPKAPMRFYNIELFGMERAALVFVELAVSILLSVLYQKMKEKRAAGRHT